MDEVVLKELDGIKIGYSGKALGNTNERFGSDGPANLAKFKAKFPAKTAYEVPAVGGADIVDIDELTPEQVWQNGADALVTKNPSALLILQAADCIPLVFYVPGQPLLALAHVGTSGAALHLPRKVVEHLAVDPASLHCYFGPGITQKSYVFSEDKFEKKLDASWDDFISHEADGIHIDLPGYIFNELKNCGLTDDNIEFSRIDTYADKGYFSHRRHKTTGEPDGRNAFGVCLV